VIGSLLTGVVAKEHSAPGFKGLGSDLDLGRELLGLGFNLKNSYDALLIL